MATDILGISAFYHDSADCLVRDGEIIVAGQDERFTRKRHDASRPKCSAEYCLRAGGIGLDGLDHVAFHDKPLLKFDPVLENQPGVRAPRLRYVLLRTSGVVV